MKMYKGFDKNLKCRDFQYEIGKTYTEDKAELCEVGFHACEHPLDCLNYYEPGESRYCDVDLDDVTDERGGDSKRVGKKITVQGEIGIAGLVKAAVNIGIDEAKSKTTGNEAHAATTGNGARAATTGNWAHAEVSGKESIASSLGIEGKAKGAPGCWIVCAEWENKNEGWHIKCVKAAAVDGERIKADTLYMLKDGEFVEADAHEHQ